MLYSKIRELTARLLGRHEQLLLSADAVSEIENSFTSYFEDEDGQWRVRRSLRIESLPAPVVLAIALYAFTGMREHKGARIRANRFFTNRAVEFLISETGSRAAALTKALILTYGFQEYLAPQPSEARHAFKFAGTSNPAIQRELSALPALDALEHLPTKHAVHVSSTWRPHAEITELIANYHPDNING